MKGLGVSSNPKEWSDDDVLVILLPMAYAPLASGEIPTTEYVPGLPAPKDRSAWLLASQAALVFWEVASLDARISASL